MCKGQAVPTNAAMKVNTVKPIVNRVRPKTIFHKTHSPFSRPFNITTALRTNFTYQKVNTAEDYPHRALQNKGIVDSGCSRHMTGNKAYLAEYQDFNGGPVAFGGSKGYITGKGKIKTGKLDFEDVCFVKELQHFNLFSVSQICDKKNKVLFTDSECLVLSPEFKLPDANQVLLRIPRQNNMYSFNLENIVPSGGLACLIAKATIDESNKWHRRFSWVFFLRTKDETSGILKDFIRQIENQLNQKVKTIRCDNGTEFKNRDFIEFCGSKGIKREYSNARTPQQNGVAERKNRTLIEAARTMLADSFLPNTFWAEAVSTACYVLNRVLVTKPHNKTPYELVTGKIPIISYIRPFGCHVTILNTIDHTIDHLGKFNGKSDKGFLVGTTLYCQYGLLILQQSRAQKQRMKSELVLGFLGNSKDHHLSAVRDLRRLISCNARSIQMLALLLQRQNIVAASPLCGQVFVDSNQWSTICIVKNPVFHSKTKHIAIRHHFIRDAYEKKLIQVLKIHTDDNVVDLLTKAFDVSSLYEVFSAQKDLDHGDVFHRLKNVPVPLNHFPINALTSKVLSFMIKKGKKISGNVTPLFASMLVQPTEDEGEASERPYESQPIPSPPYLSKDQPESQPDSSLTFPTSLFLIPIQRVLVRILEASHPVTIQAKQIKDLKAHIKKLKKKARPMITHHKAWMKSVSMKTRLAGHKSMQKKWMQKESVSKQGRKTTKSKPTAHKDQAFDDFDAIDYIRLAAHNNDENHLLILESMSQNQLSQKGVERIKELKTLIDQALHQQDHINIESLFLENDPKDKGKKVLEEEDEQKLKHDSILGCSFKKKEGESFSIHLVVYNEELAIPKQTATDKLLIKRDSDDVQNYQRSDDRVFGYIFQEFKKSKLKKHDVKQVKQSCLGEDFCVDLSILATTLNRVGRSILNWDLQECMTRSSTNKLFTPYKEPEREFRSSRRHFKTLSLDELRSPDFNLLSDQEYSEEEVAETMAETMEQYMSKTRADYGSGVARPKIDNKDQFELKGQFLKEL
ncbi:ribonuclease H-like domain-containing protein [Tanacetum coccineum]